MRPTRRLLAAVTVAAVFCLASAQLTPPRSVIGGGGGRLSAASPSAAPTSLEEGGGLSSPASLAPLAQALASNYTTLWAVVQAARMEKLFDDRTARFTVLAPTNAAFLKRLPSLTEGVGLTAAQLLSDAKGRVLEQVLNYHVIPGPGIDSLGKLALRGRLPTNAASCSNAKEISVVAEQPLGTENGGQITLASSLGGTARTVGEPQLVTGGSAIIPIDDVLLPSTVLIPTVDALAGPASLDKSALPASTLASLQSALAGREPLPLTDDAGLEARNRAARGSTAVPLPVVGGGGGGTVPDEPAPARRRVTVPTLPAADGGTAALETTAPPAAEP